MRSDSHLVLTRRSFLRRGIFAGVAILGAHLAGPLSAAADQLDHAEVEAALWKVQQLRLSFKINGEKHSVDVDSRMTLLDLLREKLQLTGTKKGCDHGQCGACTVFLNGRRRLSCLTLAAQCQGKQLTSIEGLTPDGDSTLCRKLF